MQLPRSLIALFPLSVSCVVSAAPTEKYDVAVQTTYAAQRSLKGIALAPVTCPSQLDCSELEEKVADDLADRTGLHIVGAQEVRSLMEKAGFTDLQSYESRMIMGESLSVDAFAVLTVKKAQVEIVQPREQINIKRPTPVKVGGIELQVLASDGTLLAQASGETYAVDSSRSLTSMTTNLFERMLESAWKPSGE